MSSFKPVSNAIDVGARLLKPDFEKLELHFPDDDFFQQKNIVILIHGFTANSNYLRELGEYLERYQFKCLFFNYNSYSGISTAADTLLSLLNGFHGRLGEKFLKKNINLVAHSMGGLVARAAITRSLFFFNSLVMLGTPNFGTLRDQLLIDFLIDVGEFLSGPFPKARLACQSARELTLDDCNNPSNTFIHKLNAEWSTNLLKFPLLTISGGRNEILFSKNSILNYAINDHLQAIFNGRVNDGLVPEDSVVMPWYSLSDKCYNHLNYYPEYKNINHTNLIFNQDIFQRIVDWLQTVDSRPCQ